MATTCAVYVNMGRVKKEGQGNASSLFDQGDL